MGPTADWVSSPTGNKRLEEMNREHPQLDQSSVHITKAPKRDEKSESVCEGVMREMFQT